MTSCVTGATGFLGNRVARALLARGETVRVTVRQSSPRTLLAGLPVETVTADLRDPGTLAPALDGVDTLYHVAADYRILVRDPAALDRTNVDGTAALMEAAKAAGVRRIVYTSSVAVLGTRADGQPADEETPVSEADMIGAYKRSKFRAEAMVRRRAAAEGWPVVIVNPSTPVGPGDIKPTPTGRMIRDAARGKIPAFVDTGLNIAHVDDVAMGHLLAAERGAVGERYILGGDDMSLNAILTEIAHATGRKPPKIKLPRRPLFPIAYLVEALARLRPTAPEPLMTVDGLKMAGKWMYFSSAKAKRDLGYDPRPATAALQDAVAWFADA